MKKLLTKDVADLLHITPDGIRKMENRGDIQAERIGSSQTRVYDASEVQRIAKERAAKKAR